MYNLLKDPVSFSRKTLLNRNKTLPVIHALLAIALLFAGLSISQAAIFANGKHWPANAEGYSEVPICIDPDSSVTESVFGAIIHEDNPSLDTVIKEIRRALAYSWEAHSSIRFTGWKKCNPATRDQFVDVYIHPDAPNNSYLGNIREITQHVLKDNRVTNFQPWGDTDLNNHCLKHTFLSGIRYEFDCARQYAIHEFGHLIGFTHEWQHPQTPDTCTGQAEPKVDNNDTDPYNDWRLGYRGHGFLADKDIEFIIFDTAYDYDSIMVYNEGCANAPEHSVRFGGVNLSARDKQAVAAVYPLRDEDIEKLVKTTPDHNFLMNNGAIEGDEISFHIDEDTLDALLFSPSQIPPLENIVQRANRYDLLAYSPLLNTHEFIWNFGYRDFPWQNIYRPPAVHLPRHPVAQNVTDEFRAYVRAYADHLNSNDCDVNFCPPWNQTFSVSHTFPNEGDYTVSLEVSPIGTAPPLGGKTQFAPTIEVVNEVPDLEFLLPKIFMIDDNREFPLEFRIDDPGFEHWDSYRVTVDWGDGSETEQSMVYPLTVPRPNPTNEITWEHGPHTYPFWGSRFPVSLTVEEYPFDGTTTSTQTFTQYVYRVPRPIVLNIADSGFFSDSGGIGISVSVDVVDVDKTGYNVEICWDGTDLANCNPSDYSSRSIPTTPDIEHRQFFSTYLNPPIKNSYTGFIRFEADVPFAPVDTWPNNARGIEFTVFLDTTPPVISYEITGTSVNKNNWFNTDVTVNWTVIDPETSTTLTGCGTQTLNYDTFRYRFQCEATSVGGTTFKEVLVARDTTPPEVTPAGPPNPPPTAWGWNNTDVTVNFSGFDQLSGIDTCNLVGVVDREGVDLAASASCTDIAGNIGQGFVGGINIDKTPPVLVHNGPFEFKQGSRVNLDGTKSFDPLSVIAITGWALDGDDIFDDGDPVLYDGVDASSKTIRFRAIDKAGNHAVTDTVVIIANSDPVLVSVEGEEIGEDEDALVKGSFHDDGTNDDFIVTIDWGDGSTQSYPYGPGSDSFEQSHHYFDDDPNGTPSDSYTILVMLEDNNGGKTQAQTSVVVSNMNPVARIDSVVDALSGLTVSYTDRDGNLVPGELAEVLAGTELAVVASYTDASPRDRHEMPFAPNPVVDWGDGSSDEVLVEDRGANIPGGAYGNTEAARHTYAADIVPGRYTMAVTIMDDDTGSDTPTAAVNVSSVTGAADTLQADIQALMVPGNLEPKAVVHLQKALNKIGDNGAMKKLSRGKLDKAIKKLTAGLKQLEKAETDDPGLDLSREKSRLVLMARSIAEDALARAREVASNSSFDNIRILIAELFRDYGDTRLPIGEYLSALDAYYTSVRLVTYLL